MTLSGLVKLLVVLILVFVAERYFRPLLRHRVLARTHLSPDLHLRSGKLTLETGGGSTKLVSGS